MKKKMIMVFAVMILLPVLILMVSIFRQTERVALDNTNELTVKRLEQTAKDIANMMESVEYVSDTLFRDPVLKRYIGDRTEDDLSGMLSDVAQLRDTFYNSETALNIYRVELYIDDAKMAAREYVHFFPLSGAERSDWYGEMAGQGGAGVWSGVWKNGLMLESETVELISYRRMVQSGSNIFANDGILSIDLTEALFYSYLRQLPERTGERVYLLQKDGSVLSAEDKTMLGTTLLEPELLGRLSQDKGILKASVDGEDMFVLYAVLPKNGWILADFIGTGHVLENYSYWSDMKLVLIVVLILTLFAAASFIVIHTFDREMVRRITQMAKNLEQSGGQEAAKKAPESDIDKAERLVYEMIDHNRQLVEENYQAKLEERKVQLFALQAQINPHFLYNTLECINWMAFRRGASEISEAVTMLAKYFRLSLNKGRDIVSIADEIELARTYLAIQNIRFESAIEVQITMPETMAQYTIPKLVLQPFIENAAIHGILKKSNRAGRISIEAVEEEDQIRLTVEDDGVGMSREAAAEILQAGQGDHYGIYNARSRIQLYFGNEYGVEIDSCEKKGTKVTITVGKIPL